MSEQTHQDLSSVTTTQNEYEVSASLWETLSNEIQAVSTRIDTNEPLEPDDFAKVKALRTQVDEYVTAFNRQLQTAQKDYKEKVQTQLKLLGYDKIENYIAQQRASQTQEQNKRVSDKMQTLKDTLQQVVEQTTYIKQSCINANLLSLFINRFPKIKSGAKSNEIKNWEPYEQVIKTNLQMVETFLSDTDFPFAYRLPLHSKTMQQICTYIKTGELDTLRILRTMYQEDTPIIEDMYLRDNITTQAYALSLIQDILTESSSVEHKMATISRIMEIAKNMPIGMESEKK